ncbi:hypothetical protein EVAR_25973_1 [Eumeta japonica]|uniref:Uncharacterized protein n=1 Tax=Eumeta variegata TaxID=151549 RepID=A0A4C1V1F9_EUMVA|nr:hypothetical protein EVAR_25973_1 [Eumeta japonica]
MYASFPLDTSSEITVVLTLLTSIRMLGVLKLPIDELSATSPDARHAVDGTSKVAEAPSTSSHRLSQIGMPVGCHRITITKLFPKSPQARPNNTDL